MATIYKIFPSIGIARVGDSPTDFYYGPERFRGLPTEPSSDGEVAVTKFRDAEGRLKRQAARFGVYACDDAGCGEPERLVEIGRDGVVDVEWTVHLANKKAIWFTFRQLEGEHGYAPDHPRRNASITDPALRQRLIIDPGPLTVSRSCPQAQFSKGKAQGGYRQSFPPDDLAPFPIDTLGELSACSKGRLTVLGGHGSSGFSTLVANGFQGGGPPRTPGIDSYANNDGWFDDVADGPVTARVLFVDGRRVEVEAPSWVLVTPPAFAPQVPNVVTLYDTLYDLYVRTRDYAPAICRDGAWVQDYAPDFASEIEPILQAAEITRWVVEVPSYAHYPLRNTVLAQPGDGATKLRQWVMEAIRPPGPKYANTARSARGKPLMPFQAGDNPFEVKGSYPGPRYLAVTETQYFLLQQWAKGHFRNDPACDAGAPSGRQLDEAILRNCVGGPFCPGIEITWIARNPTIYDEPFRIRHRPVSGCLSLDDHLEEGVEPGDLSKRMALPWQADFNECTDQDIEPDKITAFWWPAQRPMSVWLESHTQQPWSRGIPDDDGPGDLDMVSKWKALGFVIDKGTDDRPDYVEVERIDDAFGPGV